MPRYNNGLAAADGKWVALVSADDLLTPGSLSRAAALMAMHPRVGFVYGRARHFWGEPPVPHLDVQKWVIWSGEQWLATRCRNGNNVIASPEVVMRGSVLREIGGYRSDLPHSGDLEMWLRAAATADVGYLVGPDQAFYRQHDANMHNVVFEVSDPKGAAVDLAQRFAAFRTVFTESGCGMPAASRLEASARKTFATEAFDRAASARSRGLVPVSDEFLRLSKDIAGDDQPPAMRWPRLARRVRNRFLASFRWWRLNRVGV